MITLSDEARQFVALIEDETEATLKDCVVDDEHDRIIVVVTVGEMGKAIGKGGEQVRRLEDEIGKTIKLVEDAPTAEDFVANALAPAAVYNVTISENDDRLAYAEVAQEDHGAAIGTDGKNIDAARTLARRHYDIDDIRLT
jgi:N utilization substance protein A